MLLLPELKPARCTPSDQSCTWAPASLCLPSLKTAAHMNPMSQATNTCTGKQHLMQLWRKTKKWIHFHRKAKDFCCGVAGKPQMESPKRKHVLLLSDLNPSVLLWNSLFKSFYLWELKSLLLKKAFPFSTTRTPTTSLIAIVLCQTNLISCFPDLQSESFSYLQQTCTEVHITL